MPNECTGGSASGCSDRSPPRMARSGSANNRPRGCAVTRTRAGRAFTRTENERTQSDTRDKNEKFSLHDHY